MTDRASHVQRGRALAVLAAALAVAVWFAPLSGRLETSKGRLITQALDAVLLPLIEIAGRQPLIFGLGAVAALGVALAFGLRLPRPAAPRLPSLPERAPRGQDSDAPAAPLARRRGLAAMTDLHAEGAAAVPQRSPRTVALEETMRPLMGDDFQLTDDIADRAIALAAEWERRGTPHGEHVDPIAIIRKRREKDRDWSNDRSWFGGLPKLGGQAWPRGKDGVPLPFAAQLDLAEIAAANPDTPLPKEGSLAFFINEGAVLYVPPGDHLPTPAPEGLPPAFEETKYPLPEQSSPVTHPLFPFWPVEPVRMRMPEDLPPIDDGGERYEAIEAAQQTAMASIVPRSQYSFSASDREVQGLEGADTLWWYCADLVLRQLQAAHAYVPRAIASKEKSIADAQGYQARLLAAPERDEKALANSRDWVERYRAAIPEIAAQGRELADFIAHFAAFAAGRDPWAVMGHEEVAVLQEVMETAHRDFEHLCRWNVSRYSDDLRNAAIRRMITGDQRAVAALPDGMLALINEQYRLPSDWQHQMFGIGGCRQDALYDHLCDHLLLQIVYDHLPEFRFGDMGLWQFWISPEALAAGRWDKVELTFECS